MSATAAAPGPRHVLLTINHPNSKDFYYTVIGGGENGKPEELRVRRGDSIKFVSKNEFILRFAESPFDDPEKTVLHGLKDGDEYTKTACVRQDAILGHWYHYTVIMGDNSTDDPEIIIER